MRPHPFSIPFSIVIIEKIIGKGLFREHAQLKQEKVINIEKKSLTYI